MYCCQNLTRPAITLLKHIKLGMVGFAFEVIMFQYSLHFFQGVFGFQLEYPTALFCKNFSEMTVHHVTPLLL